MEQPLLVRGAASVQDGNSFVAPRHFSHSLSFLRFFWSVLWLLVIEILDLVGTCAVLIATASTLNSEHAATDRETLLGWTLLPPGLSIVACSLAFKWPKQSRSVVFYWSGTCLASALIGCVFAVLLASRLRGELAAADCEARTVEGFSIPVVTIVSCVLSLWPVPFRLACFWSGARVTKYYNSAVRLDAPYEWAPAVAAGAAMPPFHRGWEIVSEVWGAVTTIFCFPICCIGPLLKDKHKAHRYHHAFQVVCELMLLIVASTEGKSVELLAVCSGLVGAALGSLGLMRAGVALNFFAVILSILIQIFDVRNIVCSESDVQMVVYAILFSVAANMVRINSCMHGYLLARESLWRWLGERARFSHADNAGDVSFWSIWHQHDIGYTFNEAVKATGANFVSFIRHPSKRPCVFLFVGALAVTSAAMTGTLLVPAATSYAALASLDPAHYDEVTCYGTGYGIVISQGNSSIVVYGVELAPAQFNATNGIPGTAVSGITVKAYASWSTDPVTLQFAEYGNATAFACLAPKDDTYVKFDVVFQRSRDNLDPSNYIKSIQKGLVILGSFKEARAQNDMFVQYLVDLAIAEGIVGGIGLCCGACCIFRYRRKHGKQNIIIQQPV